MPRPMDQSAWKRPSSNSHTPSARGPANQKREAKPVDRHPDQVHADRCRVAEMLATDRGEPRVAEHRGVTHANLLRSFRNTASSETRHGRPRSRSSAAARAVSVDLPVPGSPTRFTNRLAIVAFPVKRLPRRPKLAAEVPGSDADLPACSDQGG